MSEVQERTAGSVSGWGRVTDIADARTGSRPAPVRSWHGSTAPATLARTTPSSSWNGPAALAERIRALKTRIQAGEYRPDPHLIACSILERGL